MDSIKFYQEWQERCQNAKKISSRIRHLTIIWLLSFCLSIVLCVLTYKEYSWFLYGFLVLLAFGLWGLFRYNAMVEAWKYDHVFDKYKALTSEILEDVNKAWDKGYSSIFYSYEIFFGISPGMNEGDILKTLQAQRWTKRYPKETLEDIAKIHAKLFSLMEPECKKRSAESQKKMQQR